MGLILFSRKSRKQELTPLSLIWSLGLATLAVFSLFEHAIAGGLRSALTVTPGLIGGNTLIVLGNFNKVAPTADPILLIETIEKTGFIVNPFTVETWIHGAGAEQLQIRFPAVDGKSISEIIAFAAMGTRLNVILLLKKEEDEYSLVDSDSWFLAPGVSGVNGQSFSAVLESLCSSGTANSSRELILAEVVQAQRSLGWYDEARIERIARTYGDLFEVQSRNLKVNFDLGEFDSLFDGIISNINRDPTHMPAEVLPFLYKSSPELFLYIVKASGYKGLDSERRATYNLLLGKLINKLEPGFVLSSAVDAFKKGQDGLASELLMNIAGRGAELDMAKLAGVFLETQDAELKYAVTVCLSRTNMKGAPKAGSKKEFFEDFEGNILVWTEFIRKIHALQPN